MGTVIKETEKIDLKMYKNLKIQLNRDIFSSGTCTFVQKGHGSIKYDNINKTTKSVTCFSLQQ